MLETLREISIKLWSPVGEFFSSILGTSNTWFPIISYIVLSLVGLFLLRKFLDKSVETTSSLTLNSFWNILKKVLVVLVILAIALSLYFYLDSRYHIYQEITEISETQEQDFGYLLH